MRTTLPIDAPTAMGTVLLLLGEVVFVWLSPGSTVGSGVTATGTCEEDTAEGARVSVLKNDGAVGVSTGMTGVDWTAVSELLIGVLTAEVVKRTEVLATGALVDVKPQPDFVSVGEAGSSVGVRGTAIVVYADVLPIIHGVS